MIHICYGILVIKKAQNNAIYSNIDEHRDCHTKWSDTERQISYDIAYKWNLKKGKWTYLQNRSRVTNAEHKHVYQRIKGEEY